MGVERRDEALGFVDPDAGRNGDAPAVDVEVEVLMDVQGGPFLGERGKPERLQPSAQAGDVVRPGSPTGELPREVCGREGRRGRAAARARDDRPHDDRRACKRRHGEQEPVAVCGHHHSVVCDRARAHRPTG